MSFILVLFASFLGSLHCAGMCGGFALNCAQQSSPIKSQIFYHLGRLLAYLFLGSLAIFIGKMINNLGEAYGIHQIATYLTSALLIITGLLMFSSLRIKTIKLIPYRLIAPLQKKVLKFRSYQIIFALCLGFFSSFLPCAWLYTYLTVAAGTGTLVGGLLTMFFFWLGTLPVLISLVGVSRLLTSPLKQYAPSIMAILMITAGAYSLTMHIQSQKAGGSCPHHQTK